MPGHADLYPLLASPHLFLGLYVLSRIRIARSLFYRSIALFDFGNYLPQNRRSVYKNEQLHVCDEQRRWMLIHEIYSQWERHNYYGNQYHEPNRVVTQKVRVNPVPHWDHPQHDQYEKGAEQKGEVQKGHFGPFHQILATIASRNIIVSKTKNYNSL